MDVMILQKRSTNINILNGTIDDIDLSTMFGDVE
jgi:hypothetical protein